MPYEQEYHNGVAVEPIEPLPVAIGEVVYRIDEEGWPYDEWYNPQFATDEGKDHILAQLEASDVNYVDISVRYY